MRKPDYLERTCAGKREKLHAEDRPSQTGGLNQEPSGNSQTNRFTKLCFISCISTNVKHSWLTEFARHGIIQWYYQHTAYLDECIKHTLSGKNIYFA